MAGGSDNKSERPTGRRLQKAREKGQVARSREVASAAVLFGVLLTLTFMGQTIISSLEKEMRYLLRLQIPSELTLVGLSGLINGIAWRMSFVVVPILLAALSFSVLASFLQGGLAISWQSMGFHFNKLSPQHGLNRIFSKNGLVELLKSIILIIAVSYISYKVVSQYTPLYPRLVLMDVRQLMYWTASISYEVFFRFALLLIVLAMFDYGFQRYRFLEQLKMTKQEVKEEFKEMEGDPVTKGRIRRIQREMARKRMMADVPTADVVITNPTHYAIALSYKMESMDAPKVVAKGVGYLALKIKELAQEHSIPLVENKPLAQTLYKTVEVGESIPATLYKAVAEILAYVYKAKNSWK
jgi:flagellar biosynthetic protein FlhB